MRNVAAAHRGWLSAAVLEPEAASPPAGPAAPSYAGALRRWQPRTGDKWHLDEVFIKINGRLQYLWLAVDQNGSILDILVQKHRTRPRPGASSAGC
jgi:hypothetical protein